MTQLLQFWISHRVELLALIQQHLVLVVVSTAIAVVVGVPAGILGAKRPRLGRAVVGFANVAQTIPSLALLGFLLPLPFIGGIGPRTALVALSTYAVLPIVRTTVAGIRGVDRSLVEAGIAMGMTTRQLLTLVELPLAFPTIVAGVRVATVIGVGTATVAAAVGAGGLGEYIFRGLSMVDTTTILAGALPAAALALAVDALLGWCERAVRGGWRLPRRAALTVATLAAVGVVAAALAMRPDDNQIVVGSKNFTEQVILGEIVAQTLESEGGLAVLRKLNLGGTFVCDRGLRNGDLDVYVEYTGTAVTAVFHETVPHDSALALAKAQELYARSGLSMLEPLGFNNTFAILVRGSDARRHNLRTIEDLNAAPGEWRAGFGYEFLERDDGYPGLAKQYGLRFAAAPRAMDLSLIYRALADGQVDVIAGDRTSALIDALDLKELEDNRRYFPPYDAVPVVRSASLLRAPALGRALARLAGRIADRDMRAMNAAVDVHHRDVREVAREFLRTVLTSPEGSEGGR